MSFGLRNAAQTFQRWPSFVPADTIQNGASLKTSKTKENKTYLREYNIEIAVGSRTMMGY
jgi:hypothetical protein